MIRPILFGALLAFLVSAWATSGATGVTHRQAPADAPAVQPEYTLGEIKGIDLERGDVTVKHAAIRHLGMPDMTMRFRLLDPARAGSLHPGDLVRFRAEKVGGTLVITELARP